MNINGNISQKKINEINQKISEAYTNIDFTKINYDENGFLYYFNNNNIEGFPLDRDGLLGRIRDSIKGTLFKNQKAASYFRAFMGSQFYPKDNLFHNIFIIDRINEINETDFNNTLKLLKNIQLDNSDHTNLSNKYPKEMVLCLCKLEDLNQINEFKNINDELQTYGLNIKTFFIYRDQQIVQKDLKDIKNIFLEIEQVLNNLSNNIRTNEFKYTKPFIQEIKYIIMLFINLFSILSDVCQKKTPDDNMFNLYKNQYKEIAGKEYPEEPEDDIIIQTNHFYTHLEYNDLDGFKIPALKMDKNPIEWLQTVWRCAQKQIETIEQKNHGKKPCCTLITDSIKKHSNFIKNKLTDFTNQKQIPEKNKNNNSYKTPLVILSIIGTSSILLVTIKYNNSVKNLQNQEINII